MRQIKLLLLFMFAGLVAHAQVTGVKTIPGDYPDLAAAIADLNTVGVGAGGATINITAPQTAPLNGYLLGSAVLNASVTAANPLVINGGNNLITAFAGGTSAGGTVALPDAVFRLQGTDYVTLNQLNIQENPSNTTPTTQMEAGILVRSLTTSDACKFLTITNCTVDLNGANTGITTASGPYETGISVQTVPMTQAISTVSTTAVAPVGVGGIPENIVIRGCTIQNCYNGIAVIGNTTLANYSTNIVVGGDLAGQGNTVTNTGVNTAAITTTGYGIWVAYANNSTIVNNTWSSTAGVVGAMYGIYTLNHIGTTRVSKNTLSGSSAVNSTSLFYPLFASSGSGTGLTNSWVDSNTVQNITLSGTNTFYGIYHFGSASVLHRCNDNVVNNITRSQQNGTTYGLFTSASNATVGATRQVLNNQITNFTITTSLTNTGTYYLFYPTGSQGGIYRGNVVNNVQFGGAGTGSNTIYGLYSLLSTNTHTIDSNRFTNINANNNAVSTSLYGIYCSNSSGTHNITRNNVANLSLPNTATSGTLDGAYLTGATTKNFFNNMISGLSATSMNTDNAIKGINCVTSGANNIYHNTVFLGSSGQLTSTGLNFGVSGVVWTGTPVMDLRNNIIHVDAMPAGNGMVGALRTVDAGTIGVVPTPYAATCNNNIYFAPNGTNSYLYVQSGFGSGTVTNAFNLSNDANFNASCGSLFKAFAQGRDAATSTEQNLSGVGAPTNYTYAPSGLTAAESGAQALAAVTVDYNGTSRTAPHDMGALIFTGTPNDFAAPSITYTPITQSSYCANLPVVSATITDVTGVNVAPGTAPRLYYKKSTDANAYVGNTSVDNGWKWVEASNAVSPFTFPMNAALLQSAPVLGDIIQYFIVAQDTKITPNVGSQAAGFAACPTSVALTAAAFPTTLAPTINQLTIITPTFPTLGLSASTNAACIGGSFTLSVSDTGAGPATLPVPLANYGNAVFSQTSEDELFNITINGTPLNNSSNCATIAPGAGSVAGAYGNYTTGFPQTNLLAGGNYTGSLTNGDCSFSGSHYAAIFIDYNRNGVFDLPAERVWGAPNLVPFSLAGTVNPMNFSIPPTAQAGATLMRVIVNESNFTTSVAGSWGETEDYVVQIMGVPSSLPNSAFSWSGGTITGNPNRNVTATNFTGTTTYTCTVTDIGGCTSTSSITINAAVPVTAGTISGTTTYCSSLGSSSLTMATTGGSTPLHTIWSGGPVASPTVPLCAPNSGFAGPYAPANWTITQTNSNGSVNTAGAPASIALVSSNGLSGAGTMDYSIAIPCTGTVSFNWNYTTTDGAQYDYPRYRINGGAPVIFPGYSTGLGLTPQSGTLSLPLNAGDVLGLQAYSTDNFAGACTITISNFSAPASINAVAGTTAAVNPPVGTTTYTVTVIDACGTTSTNSVTVVVGDTVSISSVPALGAICNPGDSVVMTATATGSTFSWLPVTGLNNASIANPTATPAATTTYTVTATNAGCTSTKTKTVVVAAPIVATITQNLPNPLCGVTPTLTVTATGGGAAGPPPNGAKFYIRDADPWGSAAFNTGLNAAFGVGNWTALTYAAATPATIFVPSTQFVYLEGSSGTETGQASYLAANLPLIEAWVNNGGRLLINRGPNTGGNTNFGFGGVTNNYNSPQGTVNVAAGHPIAAGPFTPAGVGPFTGGSYSHAHITGPGITPIITGGGVNVLAEKQWGAGLVLFGGYTAPSFHSPAPNAQNLFQNWMTYCATTSLGVPYTYSWAPGGATTQAIIATTSGTYTVTVNSPVGCPSGTATQTVQLNPAVTVTASASPTSVCPGAPVGLTATSATATNYVWNPGAIVGATPTVNPMSSTTYTVTATNSATGCAGTASAAVTTLSAPVFGATTATPNLVCPGDTTVLNTSATVVTGGVGPGAYTINTIPHAPVSPAGPTNAGPVGDDVYTGAISLPFPFTFYGNTYNNVYISTNGFISFDAGSGAGCCTGQVMPSATVPNNVIALAWEDMNVTAGQIDYFTFGTAPNRKFVVRWINATWYSGGGNALTGQIELNEADQSIEIHGTSGGPLAGNNTTLGIENSTGTLASVPAGFNSTSPWTFANQAWRFSQQVINPVGTYAWAASGGTVLSPNTQSTQAVTAGNTTYTVTATAGNGCTSTTTTSVTQKPLITGTATATPSAICIGGSATLSGNVPPICGGTVSGFTGAYAPANWSLSLDNSAGTVNTAGAPANVVLSTGSNISGNPGRTMYSRVIACNGNVTFNWATSTSTNNLPFLGQPQYRINSGAWTNMPGFNTGGPSMAQTGTANLAVNVNDTVTVATYTLTNDAADAYTLTISNLVAPDLPISGFVDFWDAATGGNNLGANPTVTPGAVGTATYYAQWNTLNAMGCTNPTRTPVTIQVNGLPTVTATATPAAICLGGSSVLSGGGAGVGATYVWNGPNADPYTVTPAVTTTYTVIGTDANGCSNTASATVTVNPLPVITSLTATPSPICPNGSSTLTVAPGLAGAATYCQPTYSSGSGFGDYIASVGGILTNVTGPSASPYYNYFLAPSAAVTAGTSYTLNVTVGTYSVNDVAAWIDYDQNGTFDASEKIGETYNIGPNATAVFNFTPPITALNGTTRLRIREADQGSTNMDPCTGYSFGETEDYNITISGGATPPPSFASITWSPATFLNATNTASVTASAVTATTTYTVQGTDANGCSVTSSVTLTMTPAPTGNTFGTPIVIGTLPYSASGDNLAANCWSNAYTGASNQPSADVFYQFVMPACNDSVNINTCTGSNFDTWIHLLDNAGTQIASNDDNCGTQSTINFSGLTPGATYYVVVEGFNTASGTYGLSVSTHQSSTLVPASVTASPNPACENATVTLTGAGAGAGGSYAYAGPATVTAGQFTATLAAAGVYTVTATTASGCTATATVNVTVNGLPTVTASSTPSPATVCAGGSVTLTGGGASTYAWSDGTNTPADNVAFVPAGSSTYTVTGTDANGCSNTATLAVTVNALPTVTASVSATPICLGASTTFSGGGASTYAWTDGVNTPADASPFTPPAAGTSTYTVTGTDGNGCTGSSTVQLVVNGTGTFNAPVTVSSACDGALGASVLVSSTGTTGTVTYSIAPSYPAQPVPGIFNGLLGSAAYTVTLSDANGCSNTSVVNGPANPDNGELANASLANAASQAGNTCQGQNQADGTDMSYYGATCDDLIVSVSDATGGNVLGNVNACVTVLPGVQTYNGQPYIRRSFDITPQNQGPANIMFYFTHEDITGYNANAGSYPTIPGVPVTPSNGNTISFQCSQVPQGFLPGAPGASTTVHNVTATWNAANNRWEVPLSVGSFSGFYFHTGSLPLPVTLTNFDGRKLNSSNLLEWSTSAEVNNAYFNLQYSTDGVDFVDLARVNSKAPNGNSAVALNYSYEHKTPKSGHNYYRLQQVDLDGNSTLNAKVVDLIWGADGSTVSLYPNPTKDVLNIDLYTTRVQNTTVKVLDMSGRIVKQIQARSEAGMNKLSISLGDIASGVYTVQVFENDVLSHVGKVELSK
jgi:hypothetical protein